MIWPPISVIVPTYGREEVLQATIESTLAQDYPAYEVIVVDQTRQHQPDVQAYLDQSAQDGKIRLYKVDWASLPGARNYGVARSQGEIILFIDDDVELPEGFLYAHARNYEARSDIGAVAGRVFDRMKLADAKDLEIETLP
ncbi:MAG: glycosyltransferase family A protein, partial [Cyanobacteria bacterium P01_D01_bin.128]